MDELHAPGINVNLMLCDAAQSVQGKLFILGGGLATIGPGRQPLAIALHFEVPWDQTDRAINWSVRLLDEDARAVLIDDKPVVIQGAFTPHRDDNATPGTPMGVALAINVSPLPLPTGRSYMFVLEIDGETKPDWRVRFSVRPGSESQDDG